MLTKKPTKPSIFIRADASIEIGIGHVMRTLALANEASAKGIDVYYLSYSIPKSLQKKIKKVFYLNKIDDADEIIELAKIYKPFAIILDSYVLNKEYEKTIKSSTNATIVAYEDLDNEHSSDLVINPNIYAKSTKQNHLYGTKWAMLRKEFKQRFHRTNNKFTLTVTLGGSDKKNITYEIIKHLKKWHIPFFAHIILGATNPHKHKVFALLKDTKNFKLHKNPKNFASLLADADLIISASGQTTIDVLYLNKPSIAINVVDNQNMITQELKRKKLALTLESSKIKRFPRELNRLYTFKNRFKTDRIAIAKYSVLKEIKRNHLKNFTLLGFKQSDCDELFELSNEPLIRKISLNSNAISQKEHKRWCERKLNDGTEILIARSDSGIFLGYVRFESTISIALSKFARGLGFSKILLARSLEQTDKKLICAQIKNDNFASITLFKSFGFVQIAKNADFITMEYKNEN